MTDAEIDQVLLRLESVAVDSSGWFRLYRDPATGTLWELSYPNSELHGGGPRQLATVSLAEVAQRYTDLK